MLNLAAMIDKSSRLIPKPQALLETIGFLILGFGLLLALATFTYNPQDISLMSGASHGVGADSVANLAGPTGAWLSHLVLSYFGVVGVFWPFALSVWGAMMILGFAGFPQPHRVMGFLISLFCMASVAEVQLAAMELSRPGFGFGGRIGAALSGFGMRHFGYGGSLIFFAVLLFVGLVASGNLRLSETKSFLRFSFARTKTVLASLMRKVYARPLTEEELIKQALIEEARNSRSLSKKVGSSNHSNSDQPRSIGKVSTDVDPGLSSANPIKRKAKSAEASLAKINLESIADEALNELAAEQNGNIDASAAGKIEFYYSGKSHGRPDASLFTRSSKAKDRKNEFAKMAQKLTHQLAQFKVDGKVTKISEGPVVTTFEFEPVPGTKLSKITGLAQDLARLLQASSLRILAPIPGKKVVGFEVPNAERRTIGFADLVAHRELKSSKIQLPVAMGVDAFGHVVIEDLAKMPHLLVAGSTGSGKSVFMNALIGGLIARHTAKDLRFVMVDPKMVELAAYNDLPHIACPVITDPAGEAKEKLDALVFEMEDRFNKMRIVGARNLQGFNEIIKTKKKANFPEFTGKWQSMPFIVLIIDELADMMMVLGKDAEVPITRLAQKARAAGIHLVIATQRPSAEVVTGLIKANFPTRIAFRVLSGLDSRTILDSNGAEALIGQGDMLFLNAAGLRRMHGAYLSDGEVHKMVKAAKA